MKSHVQVNERTQMSHCEHFKKALELCKQIETAVLNCTNVSAINNGMKHLYAAFMVI